MQHLIGLWGDKIQADFEGILKDYSSGRTPDVEALINSIKTAYFSVSKINKLSRIITKANFDMMSDSIRHDVFSYIEQYVEEIEDFGGGWKIDITYKNLTNSKLTLNMSSLEVSMLLDNIISNAVKAGAKKLAIEVGEDEKSYAIDFIDNGNGLSDKYQPDDYFNSGITTTNGSGIGLHHARTIVNDLEGEISIASHKEGGVIVRIRWDK